MLFLDIKILNSSLRRFKVQILNYILKYYRNAPMKKLVFVDDDGILLYSNLYTQISHLNISLNQTSFYIRMVYKLSGIMFMNRM